MIQPNKDDLLASILQAAREVPGEDLALSVRALLENAYDFEKYKDEWFTYYRSLPFKHACLIALDFREGERLLPWDVFFPFSAGMPINVFVEVGVPREEVVRLLRYASDMVEKSMIAQYVDEPEPGGKNTGFCPFFLPILL
jgi:UDP:flavonoid glycosyltransferase YjiC (YdhE family)